MTVAAAMWLGPVHSEARSAYARARNTGLSPLRALVVGTVASFRQCWTFRRNIAKHLGCSVRTVQRALTQAKSEGLIGTARAKKDEVPPGWEHGPVACGWSHRWVIGWGQAGKAVEQAVDAARARWLVRRSMSEPPKKPAADGRSVPFKSGARPPATSGGRPEYQKRSWTAEELDRELARLEAEKPPPS